MTMAWHFGTALAPWLLEQCERVAPDASIAVSIRAPFRTGLIRKLHVIVTINKDDYAPILQALGISFGAADPSLPWHEACISSSPHHTAKFVVRIGNVIDPQFMPERTWHSTVGLRIPIATRLLPMVS